MNNTYITSTITTSANKVALLERIQAAYRADLSGKYENVHTSIVLDDATAVLNVHASSPLVELTYMQVNALSGTCVGVQIVQEDDACIDWEGAFDYKGRTCTAKSTFSTKAAFDIDNLIFSSRVTVTGTGDVRLAEVDIQSGTLRSNQAALVRSGLEMIQALGVVGELDDEELAAYEEAAK